MNEHQPQRKLQVKWLEILRVVRRFAKSRALGARPTPNQTGAPAAEEEAAAAATTKECSTIATEWAAGAIRVEVAPESA